MILLKNRRDCSRNAAALRFFIDSVVTIPLSRVIDTRMRIPAVYGFIFAILFSITGKILAQNLVPNPGFEKYKSLPYSCSRNPKDFTDRVNNWILPNEATSDYFNTKCGGKVKANRNFAGVQTPQEGNAYAGFILYSDVFGSYREYLEVKLDSRLVKGKKYIVQFYVSLAEQSQYAIDRLGFFVCPKREREKGQDALHETPSYETPDSLFLDDEKEWMCIRGSFIANGKEDYLIIGNFHSNSDEHRRMMPVNRKRYHNLNETYYYIDNVCLSAANEDGTSSCNCSPSDTAHTKQIAKEDSLVPQDVELPKENTAIIFASVFFDSDKSKLKPESFPSLDSLVGFLKMNPEDQIEISGYTDNSGDEEKNLKLSRDRAEAVAKYLIAKGISKERITWNGYGSANPLVSNDTPEGRAKNRRVEYRLIRY